MKVHPKKVIKAFYLQGYLAEDDYLLLIQAIDDRNRLSHVYDEASFQQIVGILAQYATVFRNVQKQIINTAE